MEAGGSIADMMSSVAQRDRQDSANSLELATRSATVFGAVSSGGGTADGGPRSRGQGARFRTASDNGLRQQSEAAPLGLLERQVAAVTSLADKRTVSCMITSLQTDPTAPEPERTPTQTDRLPAG